MSARFERYLCPGCNVLGSHELRIICPNCHGDFLEVVELYQRICRERPGARRYTMGTLFRKLYESRRGPADGSG